MDRFIASLHALEAATQRDLAGHGNAPFPPSALLPLLDDVEAPFLRLPHNDPAATKSRLVFAFLRGLLAVCDPSGADALASVECIVPSNLTATRREIRALAEAAGDTAQPSAMAFCAAAVLICVAFITDRWPDTISLSPQDTINFKSGATTIVLDGSDEFGHARGEPNPPAYEIVPLSLLVDSAVEPFGAQLAPWRSLLCRFLALVVRSALCTPAKNATDVRTR